MLGTFAIGAAVLFALVAVFQKRRSATRAYSLWKKLPGHSPKKPLPISRFDEINETLIKHRCHCGGSLLHRAEASRQFGTRTVRVVRVECGRCEDELELFFDQSALTH